jgi:hypothetical protein
MNEEISELITRGIRARRNLRMFIEAFEHAQAECNRMRNYPESSRDSIDYSIDELKDSVIALENATHHRIMMRIKNRSLSMIISEEMFRLDVIRSVANGFADIQTDNGDGDDVGQLVIYTGVFRWKDRTLHTFPDPSKDD